MTSTLAIFMGGGLGAILRAFLVPFGNRLSASGFPSGVMLVNIIGCLLIGLFIGYASTRPSFSPLVQNFLIIGLFGGFTTFSAFAADTLRLVNGGQALLALLYVIGSVAASLLASFLGYFLVRQVTL